MVSVADALTQFLVGSATKYGMNPTQVLKVAQPADFTTGVLKGLGDPTTPANATALKQWEAAEGGPSSNPLNTSIGTGSPTGNYGSVDGAIKATVATLKGGGYGGVLGALKAGTNAGAVKQAIIASPWDGSNHYKGTNYGAGATLSLPKTTTPTVSTSAPKAAAPMNTTRDAITQDLIASGGKGLTASRLLADIQPTQTSAASVPTAKPAIGDPVAGSTPMPKSAFGELVSDANKISGSGYNYEWGGGHNTGFAPTTGSGHGSGSGVGYDCSGAISAVLHAAGKLAQPMVASQFMSYGQAGPGGKGDITIYASPTHVFAEINGKYFGTSLANPGGGAGWFTQAQTAGYTVRHVSLTGAPALHLNQSTGKVIPFTKAA